MMLLLATTLTLNAQQNIKQQALELIKKNAPALHLSTDDIDNLIVSDAYNNKLSNTIMAYVQQTYKGVAVYNGIQVFSFRDDKVVSAAGQRIAKMANKVSEANGTPVISSTDALRLAATHIGKNIQQTIMPIAIESDGKKIIYNNLGIATDNISVQLLWTPTDSGKVKLSWQVQIAPTGSSDYWLVRVDAANNTILGKDNFTVYCKWDKATNKSNNCLEIQHYEGNKNVPVLQSLKSVNTISSATYRVSPYPSESPQHPGGALALRTDPWALAPTNSPATTLKWHNDGFTDYATSRGNNVYAQEDRDANNNTFGLTANSSTPDPTLTFDFPFSNVATPQSSPNQSAALTNLFYWNNIMHDISYLYGFDEVSGNFQNYNMDRGGLGNDYVIADGQDASGTSNANFSTPVDGSRPRMQMYLWTPPSSKKMLVNAPSSFAGYKYAAESNVSTANKLVNVGPVTANIVLYNDDASGLLHTACGVAANATALAGKIALIDRTSSCAYIVQIKNAQNAGAVGAIVVNNVTGTPIAMTGTDNTITIPAVMISLTDGNAIKSLLSSAQAVNTTLLAIFLDGDFDNGIMAHEYTHGISNRLTGGPGNSSCLSNAEQMGEGWSDYLALMVTTNWASASLSDGALAKPMGTYAIGQATTAGGIRNYPYSTNLSINPWTYAMLATNTGGEVHNIGEIWCTALWEMTWALIQKEGVINGNMYNVNGTGGNSVALKLVMMGMKLQACSPGFLDGRNAILKADTILYNGYYSCAIWQAFAKRGMGASALQGSSASYTDQTAAFDNPASATIKKTANKTLAAMNEEITYSLKATAQCSSISGYSIVDTIPSNTTYVVGSGGFYDAIPRTVVFSGVNLAASQSQSYSYKVKVNTGTYFAPITHFNETVPSTTFGATWSTLGSVSGNWSISSTKSNSPANSFYAINATTPTQLVLTNTGTYNLSGVSTLSFWHYYNTESGYDGGVVEISNDGIVWTDLGPYMIQNGYSGKIASDAGTVISNRNAFTGSSSTGLFIETIVNLATFKGQTVRIRFRFITDNGTGVDGWYIDDINLKSQAGVYNSAQLYNQLGALQSSSDTLTYILNALPVQWNTFTVEKQNSKGLLKWTTAQELNTAKFVVEKSIDGINFSSIGFVAAAGNSSTPKSYLLYDAQPIIGMNYYRIKQIDLDGRFNYSETKSLYFDGRKGIMSITPNPAKDKIAISLPGNTKLALLQLMDATGKSIQYFTVNGQYMQLQLPALAAGTYFIKVTGDGLSEIQKLIIQ